ncbi:MAG: YCF48-related protein [candidate division KSB1 bacterium]|nr:YCF48-related protein [candidate division KSB1 bacterium]MDQ7065258.1 YCF48-related protein [candidate division KSB1 bacterium]
MKPFTFTIIAWAFMALPLHSQTTEWQQTNGPIGGDVNTLVATDTGTLIIGTRLDGLFRSSDGGRTWTHIQDASSASFLFNSVWDMTKNSQGHLFAATNYGIYRSTDNGDTWTPFYTGLTDRNIQALAINSTDVLFAGSNTGGMFRSEDNGENWIPINNGLSALKMRSVAINSLGDVFAGTTEGLFISSDNGNNWAEISSGLGNKHILTIFVTPEDSLFIGTYNGAFRSGDHGANWTKLVGPFGFIQSFARNSSNMLFAGGGGFFFRSIDNGLTWSQTLAEKLTFAIFLDLYVTPSQNLIAATFNNGVISSSDNGNTWEPQNTGLTAVDIVTMTQTPSGTIFAGGNNGLFRTQDGGENWSRIVVDTIGLDVRFIASSKTGRLFAGIGRFLAISDDDGESWTVADSRFTDRFPESIAFGSGSDVYVGVYGQIFKSTDGGDTWTELTTPIPNTRVQAMGVSSTGTVFAGTRKNGVYRSTDAGTTWVEVNNGLSENFDITSFLFQPNGDVLLSALDGVFRSSNNGDTWEQQGMVPSRGVKDLARDSGGNLFIAIRGAGVAVSEDDGETWIPINSGLGHKDAKTLLIDDMDHIYVGTRGGSVFKTQFFPTTVERAEGELPKTYFLEQNYPNPFNPETRIRYRLSSATEVTLAIYNPLGQLVRMLVKGRQPAGEHTVTWDARDRAGKRVASGVYVYRLSAGEFVQSRKLMLLR